MRRSRNREMRTPDKCATDVERSLWHEEWLERARREMFPKMRDSAVYMAISPDADPDPKFCVELGAAIMYDKPILVLLTGGRALAPGLARIAHLVVEIEDMSAPGVGERVATAVERALALYRIGDPDA